MLWNPSGWKVLHEWEVVLDRKADRWFSSQKRILLVAMLTSLFFSSGYRGGGCLRHLTSTYMEKKEAWSTAGLACSPKLRVTTSSVTFHYTPSSRSEHLSPWCLLGVSRWSIQSPWPFQVYILRPLWPCRGRSLRRSKEELRKPLQKNRIVFLSTTRTVPLRTACTPLLPPAPPPRRCCCWRRAHPRTVSWPPRGSRRRTYRLVQKP